MPVVGQTYPRLQGGALQSFCMIPNRLVASQTLSASAKLLWGTLYRFSNMTTGEVFPAVGKLSAALGFSDRGIQKLLGELTEKGFLQVERRDGMTNKYHLTAHPDVTGEGVNSCSPLNATGVNSCSPGGEQLFTHNKQPNKQPSATNVAGYANPATPSLPQTTSLFEEIPESGTPTPQPPAPRRKSADLIPPPYTRADFDAVRSAMKGWAVQLRRPDLETGADPATVRLVLEAGNSHPCGDILVALREIGIQGKLANAQSWGLVPFLLRKRFVREYLPPAVPSPASAPEPLRPPYETREDAGALWPRFRDAMRRRLGDVVYENWFAKTWQSSPDGAEISVQCPDAATAEFIRDEYGQELAEVGAAIKFSPASPGVAEAPAVAA